MQCHKKKIQNVFFFFLVLLRQNLDSPLEGNTIIHTKMNSRYT